MTEHKPDVSTLEAAVRTDGVMTDRRPEAMGKDVEELPPGYFYSARFIGSYCVRVPSVGPMMQWNCKTDWILCRPSASPLPVALAALPWSPQF